MDELDYAREWLHFAEMDLSSAEYLLGQRPLPIEIICFHCQQAAEKSLKGFLAGKNVRPPKTHNLLELCRLCTENGLEVKTITSACDVLNNYSVQPRYPYELVIAPEDVPLAIKHARAILSFVRPLIPAKRQVNKSQER
jgi:HEPN domain-containing protein